MPPIILNENKTILDTNGKILQVGNRGVTVIADKEPFRRVFWCSTPIPPEQYCSAYLHNPITRGFEEIQILSGNRKINHSLFQSWKRTIVDISGQVIKQGDGSGILIVTPGSENIQYRMVFGCSLGTARLLDEKEQLIGFHFTN